MAQGEQATSQIGSSSNQSSTTGAGGDQQQLKQVVVDEGVSTSNTPFARWLTTKLQENKDDSSLDDKTAKSKPQSKIRKVPEILREVNSSKDCYEPLLISLGPYHHGNDRLEQMEKLKISMMQRFVDQTREEAVRDKFLEVARNAKTDYYVLESTIDDEEFLRILFVDVCFLIQFLIQSTHKDTFVKMKSHEFAFVLRDIFLLENQLPFPIIKALMMLRFPEEEFYKMINQFISSIMALKPRSASYRERLMKLFTGKKESESSKWMLRHDTDPKPAHLLHALQMQLVDVEKLTPKNGSSDVWYSYRSVSELKAAGIHVRPRRRPSRFTDMSFDSNIAYGTLALKPMVIDDSTKALFLNLCAFEALPDTPDDLGVTSYLCFMDSLIDSTEDVKELRTRGTLFNFLGSDQQVADLFNEITDRLVPNSDAYAQVKSEIERHYNSNARTWTAQCLHEHFSTPWTILGFFLALFATVLSVVQTYFSIYPHA